MPKITLLPEDAVHDVPSGTRLADLLPGALCARSNGRLLDLSTPVEVDLAVEPVTASDPDGLRVLRHSTAHVMAQAVCDLYPGAKYAIGPAIDDGFYYDFALPVSLTPDDLEPIERRMREIVGQDQPFHREELSRPEALERFAD